MPVPEEEKLKKPKPPRTTDDFMIVDTDGNVYQGVGTDGVARFGHPTYGEIFRHRATAQSLASQSKISAGRQLSVVPMSNIKTRQYH